MVRVNISEELLRKVRAFKKVIDTVLGEELPSEEAYIELILTIGLEKMLQDPLPKEEMLLKTMVAMFEENPEFVSDFISKTLRKGELIEKKREDELRKIWQRYVV